MRDRIRQGFGQLPGAIAQLGERLHGMQEVASSSLAGSSFISGVSDAVLVCHPRTRLLLDPSKRAY